jgi:hypothetical protein
MVVPAARARELHDNIEVRVRPVPSSVFFEGLADILDLICREIVSSKEMASGTEKGGTSEQLETAMSGGHLRPI